MELRKRASHDEIDFTGSKKIQKHFNISRKHRGNAASVDFHLFFILFRGYVSKQDWGTYLTSLNLFYGIFLSALLPSFLAIFAVYQELKTGTIKSALFSGHSRAKTIEAKIAFVSLYIVLLYTASAFLVVGSGVILGFDTAVSTIVHSFLSIFLVGIGASLFAPLMIFLTLLFKNFVAPLIIAFFGTIGSIVLLNIGNAFYYPWLLPANLFFRFISDDNISIWPPMIVFAIYFLVSSLLCITYFVRLDIDNKVG